MIFMSDSNSNLVKFANDNQYNKNTYINPNILLNERFSINQRGEETYSGKNIYSLDRWKLGNELSTMTTNSDNKYQFAITGSTTNANRILFTQLVEDYEFYKGSKVSASFKFSNLTETVANTTYLAIEDGTEESLIVLNNDEGFATVTHTVSNNATKLSVSIVSKSGKDCSLIPVWCKLEIGEVATAFAPRQISEELWLCQRYYQRVILDGQIGNYVSPLNIQPLLILANSLRTTPTITIIKQPLIYGLEKNTNVYSSFESQTFTLKKLQNNLLSIIVKTGGNATTMNFISSCFYSLKNGEIALDSEMYD